ncbi:multiple epidermal growth factor-like domains protein 11 [Physella acuta]|uniref:multiple epidermal growth factor-like domains protein 11 n=1 Tax=Physella acuta TaxID=109671 RepID=UPI0027DCB77B|nr:multiple epidermal growth factor-like domains protein 11 [Physella acuta]
MKFHQPSCNDNDNDGRIDEDLSKLSRQNGGWSPWVYTECSRNCSDYKRTASRKCDKPETQNFGLYCEGVGFELQEKGCHVTLKCPGLITVYVSVKDCPLGTWDFNCKGVCLNCHPDCDKWNGTCQHCTRGHKLADGKCEHVCTAGTYGFACGGNCLEKCGTDCIDRVHGKCPGKDASNSFSYFWLGVLSLPLLIVLVLYLRIRDRKEMEALKPDDTSQNNL